jgi:hypothetical protein
MNGGIMRMARCLGAKLDVLGQRQGGLVVAVPDGGEGRDQLALLQKLRNAEVEAPFLR